MKSPMSEERMFLTPPSRLMSGPQPVEGRSQSTLSENAKHELKMQVHQGLLRRSDLERLNAMQAESGGRQRLLAIVLDLLAEQLVPLSGLDRDQIAGEILDEVLGLGPLEPLLKDPTVSDILVNTFKTIYVERRGRIERTTSSFRDAPHLMHIVEKIVSAVGRRIDESSPMVDARLLDGSRVNVVIPPLAIDGPLVSIRKFSRVPLEAEDLLRCRTLTPQMLEILASAVRAS